MVNIERQQTVYNLLKNFQGIDPLKELFWTQLNYERVNQPLSRRGWTENHARLLADDPLLFAGGGDGDAFHVIYSRLASDKLLIGYERPIVLKLLREHPYALFVFSNGAQDRWHFINVKHDKDIEKRRIFRRITVAREERLRTASERIALLDLAAINTDLFGLSPLAIQNRHDEAFDVEAVTKQFFDKYQTIFNILQRDLEKQTRDKRWAHDYALQFLSRCMFLYFIQRKGWLGGDMEFLRTFWEAYKASSQLSDVFVDKWLKVLFFEAFNNKFHGGHRHFPKNIGDILQMAPYLNGGLFMENDLDRKHPFSISDSLFKQLFTFLEQYNFTIAEDSPLDQEVAVDPEMIGKVYESLVNVSEEASERGDAGIFYTPRIEITLMCRLALVNYLANHLGEENKSLIYELVFAFEPDEKQTADKKCAEAKLWEQLLKLLKEITVLDPACGSGSFLVGMLYILYDLINRANQNLRKQEDSYDLKKQIIGESLYGVDVMDWACHVSELRLWLALIADAELDPHDLHIRTEPLLPHFSFKIRCGDSLVQEVGGINLYYVRGSKLIPPHLKSRITHLKTEKLKFYNNDPDCQFKTVEALNHEELRLFQDMLDSREQKLQEQIKSLRRKIEGQHNVMLDGTVERKPTQMGLEVVAWQREKDIFARELEQVSQSRAVLRTIKGVPFVWDIAFVEIFESDNEGFDIVVGNPPYVRQEQIADPCLPREKVTTENKKVYKGKLARSIYQAFPRFFSYNPGTQSAFRKIDAKSDLYVYFYFHSLSLLNKKGSFCFITSNSWLDVGYGKDLQEFLLKHVHTKLVLDNQVKRSFASADVNTIIVLFSSPDDKKAWALDKMARFVMFKAPFEHVLSPVIFEEIEETNDRVSTPEYRLFPVRQEELLKDGCELEEDEKSSEFRVQGSELTTLSTPPLDLSSRSGEKSQTKGGFEGSGTVRDKKSAGILIKSAKYIGNKWGGKYLRAPDIYWTILEKGKGKLVRLGDIAEVRFGIKTGANEFFYLDEAKIREWGIEEEFLKPVIVSPRECESVYVKKERLKHRAFVCNIDQKDLRNSNSIAYIKWGEKRGFHNRPSCKGRSLWYSFPERNWAKVLWPMIHNDRQNVFWNLDDVAVDHNLFEILGYDNDLLWGSLSWTGQVIFRELYGRANLGQGALKTEGIDIRMLYVFLSTDGYFASEIQQSRKLLSQRPIERVKDESEKPSRQALDDLFFDALNLTQTERDAVYEAVINLVEARLKKAGSV